MKNFLEELLNFIKLVYEILRMLISLLGVPKEKIKTLIKEFLSYCLEFIFVIAPIVAVVFILCLDYLCFLYQ